MKLGRKPAEELETKEVKKIDPGYRALSATEIGTAESDLW